MVLPGLRQEQLPPMKLRLSFRKSTVILSAKTLFFRLCFSCTDTKRTHPFRDLMERKSLCIAISQHQADLSHLLRTTYAQRFVVTWGGCGCMFLKFSFCFCVEQVMHSFLTLCLVFVFRSGGFSLIKIRSCRRTGTRILHQASVVLRPPTS